MSARCEYIRQRPQVGAGTPCGAPVEYRYPAMRGGYMHLCREHGTKHVAYSERLVDGRWVAPPPPPPKRPREDPDGCDRATGRALRVWMKGRGLDLADVARETGYAVGTVECWLTGWALSKRALQRLAVIGFAPEAR